MSLTWQELQDRRKERNKRYRQMVSIQKRYADDADVEPSRGDVRDKKGQRYEPEPETVAEAERAYRLGRSTITAELAGDPLPGRSALDKIGGVFS